MPGRELASKVISRLDGREQVYFTSGVSRQSPPEVEPRLAKVDGLEQRVEDLAERLQQKKDSEEDPRGEIHDLERKLTEERRKQKRCRAQATRPRATPGGRDPQREASPPGREA